MAALKRPFALCLCTFLFIFLFIFLSDALRVCVAVGTSNLLPITTWGSPTIPILILIPIPIPNPVTIIITVATPRQDGGSSALVM